MEDLIKGLSEFLDEKFLGNKIEVYLLAVGIFIGSFLVLLLLEKLLLARIKKLAEKTATPIDDFAIGVFRKTILPVLYIGALYFAIKPLKLAPAINNAVVTLAVIVLTIQATRLFLAVTLFVMDNIWIKEEDRKIGRRTPRGVLTVIKVVFWGIGIVFILGNLGFNISAVVAGLGIGGVAIALAAQAILGDLFNSFVIYFDKPFERGDFIIIDNYMGVIEHIGIKSTRIRSLGGEQLVFSNSDLTSNRIRNYKRMAQRRILFKVGVTYQTSLEQLKKIPGIVKKIIDNVKDVKYDRAHFKAFGDFSLDIEIVYYVFGGDYNKYMDIQQQINLALVEAFAKENIEFAYPTQTLFVNKTS